jgi:hypothetical protein
MRARLSWLRQRLQVFTTSCWAKGAGSIALRCGSVTLKSRMLSEIIKLLVFTGIHMATGVISVSLARYGVTGGAALTPLYI